MAQNLGGDSLGLGVSVSDEVDRRLRLTLLEGDDLLVRLDDLRSLERDLECLRDFFLERLERDLERDLRWRLDLWCERLLRLRLPDLLLERR